MPTLAIRFTAGRYHATPWYRHVNEGAVEWPPAPWRLLRALLAVGFAKQQWPGSVAEIPQDARALIGHLASVRPCYRLPRGAVAHTRHYMPIVEGAKQSPTKVLDTFLRMADPGVPLLIHWDLSLTDAAAECLQRLVGGLAYLGRAESWVSAEVLPDVVPDEQWSRPHVAGEPVPSGWEQVPLLAPVVPCAYTTWRERELAAAIASAGKVTSKQRAKIEGAYPSDLLACLCQDTALIQKAGWSQPPGSERVLYLRRADALEPGVARPRRKPARIRPVEAALFSLASDTRSGQLCPLMTRALPHMERLHDTAVRNAKGASPVLRGCDDEQRPLQGHRHAHWIPLDLDADGRIEHVLVHAPMELDAVAQEALGRIDRTYGKDLPEIVVSLAGFASLGAFRRQLRDTHGDCLPCLGTSRVWESQTPFLAPRFLKAGGRNSLIGQVRSECESRGLPVPELIEDLGRDRVVEARFLEYVRVRPGKEPPQTRPFALRLLFSEAVSGPVCLGYASHFGLGLFAAVPEAGAGSGGSDMRRSADSRCSPPRSGTAPEQAHAGNGVVSASTASQPCMAKGAPA